MTVKHNYVIALNFKITSYIEEYEYTEGHYSINILKIRVKVYTVIKF